MRLLLDTNALLWWRDESPRLPKPVADEIGNPQNDILVSITSLWEIAIKRALGKLQFHDDFAEVMAEEEFTLLPIGYAHLQALGTLPLHHRDPFDRLLIAQALAENVPVVTNDRLFARYDVKTVW
jgi:PIN domain nuclease of toxin-antitoxin system